MEAFAIDPLLWTSRIISVAIALQSVELILLRSSFADDGIWRWADLRSEFSALPRFLRGLLDLLLRYESFVAVLWLRLASAVALLWYPETFLLLFLFVSTLLICIRWRGTFNGGSDYMTVLILGALSVASAWRESGGAVLGALWFVVIQLCLSYFVAGVAKLRQESWREGSALRFFVVDAMYEVPPSLSSLMRSRGLMLAASWGIIVFECCFSLALVSPALCLVFIGFALLFHLANVFLLGLNRFLFAWAAAYPALYFCSTLS